jgi:aminomethyltransferase
MSNENLAKTSLHTLHLQLGARMVPFAGFDMPVQYAGVLEETRNVRKSCGLFDVSHMGQFVVHGKRALEEVAKLVTNDVKKMHLGQAQYNMLCNPEGGVIDDLVVYRRSEKEVYICVNASNRAADFAWMKSRLSAEVSFEDQSEHTALIALQGPAAESILSELISPELVKSLKYYHAADAEVLGVKCYLSRTGYTGEDGFELYIDGSKAPVLWEALLERGRKDHLIPCGLGARDTLRLEMGYPLHGHELSPTISPLSAGLGWTVKLKRADTFVGQEFLKQQAAAGPEKVLKAFVVQDRRIARQGYKIAVDADGKPRTVGEVSSGTFSPHLNCPIALGFVDRSVADHTKFFVEIRDAFVAAETVKLPFVKSATKK